MDLTRAARNTAANLHETFLKTRAFDIFLGLSLLSPQQLRAYYLFLNAYKKHRGTKGPYRKKEDIYKAVLAEAHDHPKSFITKHRTRLHPLISGLVKPKDILSLPQMFPLVMGTVKKEREAYPYLPISGEGRSIYPEPISPPGSLEYATIDQIIAAIDLLLSGGFHKELKKAYFPPEEDSLIKARERGKKFLTEAMWGNSAEDVLHLFSTEELEDYLQRRRRLEP